MVLSCGNIHELYILLSFCSFPTGHFHLLHSSSLPLYSWPRLLWENVSHSWADLGSALPSRLLWGAETLMSLTDTALTWQEPLSLGCSEPDWPLWTPIIYCIRVIIRWKQSRWLRDLGSAESREILYNRCRLHWWSIMAQYGQLSCEILAALAKSSQTQREWCLDCISGSHEVTQGWTTSSERSSTSSQRDANSKHKSLCEPKAQRQIHFVSLYEWE